MIYYGKQVRVLLKGQAKESYLKLKKENVHPSVFRSIENKKELLKKNPQYGEPIAKRKIPKSLLKEGIQNLYRVELADRWRMLYTIEGNKVEILLFVLKILNHKKYDKLFGYK